MRGRYKPRGMSPSAAYDSAGSRSPKHDQMQASVMRSLLSDPAHQQINFVRDKEKRQAVSIGVIPEFDFMIMGSIVGFADLVQIHQFKRENAATGYQTKNTYKFYSIFELKPEITSVGGLIRQARVLEHHAHASLKEAHQTEVIIRVFPVVMDTDPNLELFRFMYREVFCVWNEADLKLTRVVRERT